MTFNEWWATTDGEKRSYQECWKAAQAAQAQAKGGNDSLAPSQAAAEPEEPVTYQFQGRDGTWHEFTDRKHYENTVADGTWPIRALYASPQPTPGAQDPTTTLDLLDENERLREHDAYNTEIISRFAEKYEAVLKDRVALANENERLREILSRALAQMRTQRRIDRAEFPSESETEIALELE